MKKGERMFSFNAYRNVDYNRCFIFYTTIKVSYIIIYMLIIYIKDRNVEGRITYEK